MFALYILLAGLILSLPAVVGTVLNWGTPLATPFLVGFTFAYTPFVAAAFLHRQIRALMSEGEH